MKGNENDGKDGHAHAVYLVDRLDILGDGIQVFFGPSQLSSEDKHQYKTLQ